MPSNRTRYVKNVAQSQVSTQDSAEMKGKGANKERSKKIRRLNKKMAFGFGKKKEESKPTTLEEVRKAYENLSEDDKKSFHQSIADRVHESIAAQEEEHGQEDSQSAEAREHEALGEEHAEGKGDVEELHEADDTPEEKAEDKIDEDKPEEAAEDDSREEDNRNEVIKSLTDRIGALEESFKEFGALKEKMDEYIRKQSESFGLGGKVIGGSDKNMSDMSASELKDAILSGQK